jgi:hypothetical protein
MTVTAPPRSTVRIPLAVRAGAVLLGLLLAVSTLGLILHGIVWSEEPFGPGLVFAAFMLATAATAAAAIPSLLHGTALGWALTFGWACCYTYWSVYKVFGEQEWVSLSFLSAGVGVVALLATRTARTHAGIAR